MRGFRHIQHVSRIRPITVIRIDIENMLDYEDRHLMSVFKMI